MGRLHCFRASFGSGRRASFGSGRSPRGLGRGARCGLHREPWAWSSCALQRRKARLCCWCHLLGGVIVRGRGVPVYYAFAVGRNIQQNSGIVLDLLEEVFLNPAVRHGLVRLQYYRRALVVSLLRSQPGDMYFVRSIKEQLRKVVFPNLVGVADSALAQTREVADGLRVGTVVFVAPLHLLETQSVLRAGDCRRSIQTKRLFSSCA